MYVYDTNDFPFIEFGIKIKRKVRLIFSPDTGNYPAGNIVVVDIPPNAVSEGHVHNECDEIIHFNIGGRVIIDGKKYDVPENGFVLAPKGAKHECLNISESRELQLICIFSPAFKPYGKYPELIKNTNNYFKEAEKRLCIFDII